MDVGFFTNHLFTFLVLVLGMFKYSNCLQCWKCIGKSCGQNPADNYRATQMTCQQGESCMKVYYRMTENGSHILETTTRTCSAGHCVQSSYQDFEKCLQTTRRYNVLGCSLRMCCHDTDLCNHAGIYSPSLFTTVFMLVMCIDLV